MSKQRDIECLNGCELDSDELENPKRDAEGTVWCDECWRRVFTFDCVACDNYEHEENQHRYLVVANEDEAEIPTGVYRIVGKPYALVSILGPGSLSKICLLRVGDNPARLNMGGYPCGHLCVSCSEPYEKVPGKPCITPIHQW